MRSVVEIFSPDNLLLPHILLLENTMRFQLQISSPFFRELERQACIRMWLLHPVIIMWYQSRLRHPSFSTIHRTSNGQIVLFARKQHKPVSCTCMYIENWVHIVPSVFSVLVACRVFERRAKFIHSRKTSARPEWGHFVGCVRKTDICSCMYSCGIRNWLRTKFVDGNSYFNLRPFINRLNRNAFIINE